MYNLVTHPSTLSLHDALPISDELRMHLRGALNNGVTREEIREVLLQTAIYCGVLAANSAFHRAQEVFAQRDRSEEHTSELQSLRHLVCRLLLEKKIICH